ncbi:hypothetical protein P9112_014276 [Eukaryota sp. TZLM1-RC]
MKILKSENLLNFEILNILFSDLLSFQDEIVASNLFPKFDSKSLFQLIFDFSLIGDSWLVKEEVNNVITRIDQAQNTRVTVSNFPIFFSDLLSSRPFVTELMMTCVSEVDLILNYLNYLPNFESSLVLVVTEIAEKSVKTVNFYSSAHHSTISSIVSSISTVDFFIQFFKEIQLIFPAIILKQMISELNSMYTILEDNCFKRIRKTVYDIIVSFIVSFHSANISMETVNIDVSPEMISLCQYVTEILNMLPTFFPPKLMNIFISKLVAQLDDLFFKEFFHLKFSKLQASQLAFDLSNFFNCFSQYFSDPNRAFPKTFEFSQLWTCKLDSLLSPGTSRHNYLKNGNYIKKQLGLQVLTSEEVARIVSIMSK